MGAQVEEVMMSRPMQRGATPQGAAANSTYVGSDDCVCMRLDFMEALVQSRDGNSFVNYNHQNTANVQLGASIASLNPGNILGTPTPTGTALDSASKDLSNQSVALIYCPEGKIPTEKPNFADPESDYFKSLPIDAGIADSGASNSFYVFDKAVTYKLLADEAAKDEQLVAKDQDEKASVWVVPFAQITSDPADPTKTELVIPGNGPLNTAKKLTSQIGQNIYEWLYSQDEEVEFKSFYADSVGDAKIEVYAEQNISDRLRIELSGTVVLPTGGKALYKSNPYQMYAGNGGHWEVAPGALIALKACDFISVKADAKYSFVLNAVEERGACFVGAKIKNIGPKVEADVKWRYFTGNVDINFTHPNTAAITGLVGYQFNYKHKEVLKYVVSDMESWLGKEYNKTNDCFVNAPFPLDEDLAVIYTNSISHKLRFESSFLLSGWMEFFCGGSWAFMGKNAMATIDAHVGFHVAF